MEWRSRRRRVRYRIARMAFLLLFALPGDAAASEELADLSLEELLEQQLDQMAISGIHHTHEKGE